MGCRGRAAVFARKQDDRTEPDRFLNLLLAKLFPAACVFMSEAGCGHFLSFPFAVNSSGGFWRQYVLALVAWCCPGSGHTGCAGAGRRRLAGGSGQRIESPGGILQVAERIAGSAV